MGQLEAGMDLYVQQAKLSTNKKNSLDVVTQHCMQH